MAFSFGYGTTIAIYFLIKMKEKDEPEPQEKNICPLCEKPLAPNGGGAYRLPKVNNKF